MTLSELIVTLSALISTDAETGALAEQVAREYPGGASVEIQTCPRPLVAKEVEGKTVLCGVVVVPEDHDNPTNGNMVELEFVLLKAESHYPKSDPLLYLHGGPGGGNLPGGVKFVSENFAGFRDSRDIIAFDQRAAGISSGSVDCKATATEYAEDVMTRGPMALREDDGAGGQKPSAFLIACLEELRAAGRDLTKYNTRQNALDAQMLMRSLGYAEWNLYGASYGTKLSMEIMRTAPEGVRAVVLDGVASPVVELYNAYAQPLSEALEQVVRDCNAETACAAAYPDLADVINAVLSRARTEGITWRDKVWNEEHTLFPMIGRNVPGGWGSITPYVPAFFYELHRGGETPTVDLLAGDWNYRPPVDLKADLINLASETLSEAEVRIVNEALRAAEISDQAQESLASAVAELCEQLRRDREFGSLPALLDFEMSAALPDLLASGSDAREILRAYSGLRIGNASRERLLKFVTINFDGARRDRIIRLVEAMNDAEIVAFFDTIETVVGEESLGFLSGIDLYLYMCQEDVPYNTIEKYEAYTKTLPFPTRVYDKVAANDLGVCSAFEQVQRDNWHDVVVSDIPTLSLGGGADLDTAASWAKKATEGLTNAQSFVLPEAGHITIRYFPDCVSDMAHAFLDNPDRELGDACVREAATPTYHIAPWASNDAK